MGAKPTYEELRLQVESLSRRSEKLARAEKAVQQQNRYLTILHETSLGLINKLDKTRLLETILKSASDLARTDHVFIYLKDKNTDDDYIQICLGTGFFENQVGRRARLGEGLGGKVWETGRPILIDDYSTWKNRIDDPGLNGLHCMLGIPLNIDQSIMGIMGLAHVEPGKKFAQDDIMILSRLATLALLALEKAELYTNARRELEERKKAEALIRENEQRYLNLLESSPDPIVVYNMEGVATYVNPAFEQTFGLSRNELLGKQIDFVPPEAWPETKAAIDAMLNGKKINLFETRRFTRDGRLLDVQISSTLYLDQSGKPSGNIVTLRDISARKVAERVLYNYQNQLEELVEERTSELGRANRKLGIEIEERKRAEKALRQREKEQQAQAQHLEEVNTALRVLIKQREIDKTELQENVLSNVKELVTPYLNKIKKSRLSTRQLTMLNILESNLNNIISPFINKLSTKYFNFTPTEIRVANLIKEGKTNKEIAEVLLISKNTVLFHRHNIRTKLKIKNTRVNLRSRLLSFDE
ncbi:MAG: hypothetical protein DRH32_08165 [Deltaproteobacteria bacterium]|nr:MAG: hypothetical protein DRH32_08165 [Deltaproteobacteria bacterium]